MSIYKHLSKIFLLFFFLAQAAGTLKAQTYHAIDQTNKVWRLFGSFGLNATYPNYTVFLKTQGGLSNIFCPNFSDFFANKTFSIPLN